MKSTLLLKYIVVVSILITTTPLLAQVGINTTSPASGSMLDIESTDKGLLVPRVDIANVNTLAPITGGGTESLLVYNTNSSTGIGFFYWSGSQWVPVGNGKFWKKDGDAGTTPGIGTGQDFLGTTDGQEFIIGTNNTEALTVSVDQRLHANEDGSNGLPTYSFNSDTNTGMWRSSGDRLNLTAGGREFIELFEGSDDELRINDGGADVNTRIESDNNANAFFVDGANDNIGIGTGAPNNSAQLEMADTDRGILINRVALTATNSASPVSSPAPGLLVYNTANSSSGSTEVLPGFYYWDGSRWIAMGGTGGRDWSLEGNAGTNPGTNFLGTTDATDFVIRTNDSERMRVLSAGNVGFGAAPYTNAAVRVGDWGQTFGLISETSSSGGAALYGSDTGTGLGIFGTSSNNHGIYGTTAFTGSAFLIGGIIGWGTGANMANGVLAVSDQQPTSTSNMGIRAVSGSTTSISSTQVLNVGVNTNATDLAVYALTEGPITSNSSIEAARYQTNYTGIAIDPDSRDPRAQLAGYNSSAITPLGSGTMYYGGYFYSGGSNSNSSYAYAGARFNGTNYKIIGNGTVSTIVEGAASSDSPKVMFAPEAPEVLLEDYGTGQLVNGTATISIDPIFTKNIVVNSNHPLKVFIQLEGDCNGVYVTNKTANGFTVKELQNGNSNVAFSWHIVANRKDDMGRTAAESVKYSELRFPDAPGAITPTEGVETNVQEEKTGPKPTINSSQQP